jgi:hypothetical protein
MLRLRLCFLFALAVLLVTASVPHSLAAQAPARVEGQPLAANVERVLQALEFLGAPLPPATVSALRAAGRARDSAKLQRLLDPHVLFHVSINPESRVKVARGAAPAVLQQAGYRPVLVKVLNQSTVTARLRIGSRQAGPVYAGVAELSMQRQQQPRLRQNENVRRDPDRFLDVELFTGSPMTETLSGLEVEYAIALIYSSEAGKREATIGFEVGQGTQDLGFRAEVPVLFDVRPAVPVRLAIRDTDGRPTAARLVFRDEAGHVYPPQVKRLAPDFFFQEQVYRKDGDTVLLPPGRFRMRSCRGPEYRVLERGIVVPAKGPARVEVPLERWVSPAEYGFYPGDHHIHAAGCAHYESPTQGVTPRDMFLQVKGEGLAVGCILTWGPCFNYQRQFFSPGVDTVSERDTLLKYDLEISGFGSQALGHVCLLNLKDQIYPGSDGSKDKGWPTWTTPVLRWAKAQGAVTGYAHSASGLHIDPPADARRMLGLLDANKDAQLSADETAKALLPEPFAEVDGDRNGTVTAAELERRLDRAADRLPNLAVPAMNGVGAQEICVSTAMGVCDFISAMDSARIPEWNCWYHLLNCGFPLKVSGETDFPCMSSTRVGQGRVYVQLGKVDRISYAGWCEALRQGRSYVSDGFAHALRFTVENKSPGDEVRLERPGAVQVRARVAFAPETPKTVAQGEVMPALGLRVLGDTVLLHGPRTDETVRGGTRRVELVMNGRPVALREVPADGREHDLEFSVSVERSSWIALRQFPQLHTNPVNVLIGERPIRASRDSARWCAETIRQLWRARGKNIAESERGEAERTFQQAIGLYEKIAAEAQD